ncbi:cysteine--tRNA ligase [Pueribacillus theae]|uniref:Cysteine--tRNA ligase n=1 Tax=Pueribacillus theae TaxID=2171751 RepID=A0A2U1K7L2_9BACI|nr:cysteine--tRNA ligase [Pueribacillus theae]PWA12973.1 cysteine--tRNA ligase [Pueribacillus theae]
MSIKLYNTLTRKKETFIPIEDKKVKMYVCGPTVYNYIHIGNARPPIVFDTVRRYFQYRGYDVYYVSNFTDVDDKIIKAAKEIGEEVPKLAERFIKAYHEDTEALGVRKADVHPRVMENMDEIIDFVEALIEKGYAYEADGDVYFKTREFEGYGKLSHQSIDDLRLGARIEVGEKKQDPLDFTIWKAAKEGEIAWDSPWGKGRPGWHIECSAMAKKYLGETIDIHAGGRDLAFPHHENEIAQTEALTGKPFANYWMHNGYIKINDEKMSKSLGNVVLVHELIQNQDPNVVRFFMLSVHYRNPINFNDELLESARSGLERLKETVRNLEYRMAHSANLDKNIESSLDAIQRLKKQFIEEMDDDFNTANAIAVLFELAKEANRYLANKNSSKAVLSAYLTLFEEISTVLGIPLKQEEALLDEEIEKLIEERNQARKERQFARADEIRDQLLAQHIILEDTPQGVRWKRKE